jgi:hypothetical protein
MPVRFDPKVEEITEEEFNTLLNNAAIDCSQCVFPNIQPERRPGHQYNFYARRSPLAFAGRLLRQ